MNTATVIDFDISKYQHEEITLDNVFQSDDRLEEALDAIFEMSDDLWDDISLPQSVWEDAYLIY